MRLDVERSGGFAGRTVHWSLELGGLDPAEHDDVQALLDGVRGAAPGTPGPAAGSGADRFHYHLLLVEEAAGAAGTAGQPLFEVSLDEPLPPPAQQLVELVRTRAAAAPPA